MRLVDVNVLVAAFRDVAPGHKVCRDLVAEMVDGPLPYGVSELVLSGFLRVVTHPRVFDPLCRSARARGNLTPDAYLAALAIESGCEWVTADRDYGRFPDLRWTLIDLT